jgi:hypothetical protein
MRTNQRRRGARSGRLPAILFLLLLMVVAVAACGGSSAMPVPGGTTAQAPEGDGGQPMPAASAAAAVDEANGLTGSGEGALPDKESGGVPSAVKDDLLVVYTGNLELVVDDLQVALAKAKTAVLATGGYIGASQESNNGDRPVAVITYRVPASRWEDSLTALRGLAAKVVGEQTQATEVGGQMVDLEARLRNLRASEDVLVGIAKGTGKVTDLLEVEARISDVRGQIEQLDGERARLADQAAYGTLVATFGTEVAQVQETAAGWDPRTDLDGATATLIGAGQSIVSALIWFAIVWLPVLLLLGILAFVGYKLVRRFSRHATPPTSTPSGPVPGWGENS